MATTHSLILLLLIIVTHSYIQIQISKYQLTPQLKNHDSLCLTKQIDQQITNKQKETRKADDDEQQEDEIDDEDIKDDHNYKEVCYEKDISYSMEISLNHESMFVSVDTTIPISWIKGQKCHIEGSSKKCSLVKQTIGQKVKKMLHKHKKTQRESDKQKYAMIEGSSQLVKGAQQKIDNFNFIIKDTSKLNRLVEILMLGFYMRQEHEIYVLRETNIINATEISQNSNYLIDGAVSFRFDEMSENSFLKELFEYQEALQHIISIYIDPSNKDSSLTIGELSTKYSKYGFGGIQWIPVEDDEYYGKLPVMNGFIIDAESQNKYFEIRDKEYPVFFSLSASYIGLPKQLIGLWIDKLGKKLGCKIDEQTKYMSCHKLKQKDLDSSLTFIFQSKKMSIPMQSLILRTQKNSTILNIKQTYHENYTIFGEPIFFKFFIAFDYKNNKIGFAEKSEDPHYQFISLVVLIRFVCMVFLGGCLIICCWAPVQKCCNFFNNRKYYAAARDVRNSEARRLKPVSSSSTYVDNPYEQLSGQIKNAFEDEIE